jgi:ABC-type branched-subunit amino acid transport system substrate-binding protein
VTAILGPTLSSEAFAAAPVAQENKYTDPRPESNAAENLPQIVGEYYFRALMPESTMIPYTGASAPQLHGAARTSPSYTVTTMTSP